MEKAKIVFNDKTELEVDMNGSCFIVDEKINFPEDLTTVTVVVDDYEKTFKNAEVIECASVDGRYWFAFLEMSELELKLKNMEQLLQIQNNAIAEMSEVVYE